MTDIYTALGIPEEEFLADGARGSLVHWTGVALSHQELPHIEGLSILGGALRQLEQEYSAEEKQEKLVLIKRTQEAWQYCREVLAWVKALPGFPPYEQGDEAYHAFLRRYFSNYSDGFNFTDVRLTDRVPQAIRDRYEQACTTIAEWDAWRFRAPIGHEYQADGSGRMVLSRLIIGSAPTQIPTDEPCSRERTVAHMTVEERYLVESSFKGVTDAMVYTLQSGVIAGNLLVPAAQLATKLFSEQAKRGE